MLTFYGCLSSSPLGLWVFALVFVLLCCAQRVAFAWPLRFSRGAVSREEQPAYLVALSPEQHSEPSLVATNVPPAFHSGSDLGLCSASFRKRRFCNPFLLLRFGCTGCGNSLDYVRASKIAPQHQKLAPFLALEPPS